MHTIESTIPRQSTTKTNYRNSQCPLPVCFATLPVLFVLGLPLLAIALRIDIITLGTYLRHPLVIQAINLSLRTTILTTLLVIVLGTPLAYLLARREVQGRYIIDTLIDLPMTLPPAVAGIALLMAFGRQGIVGTYLDAVGMSIAFTQVAVVLAQFFVAAPYYIKAAAAGFAGVDHELEHAAALDGANRWDVFRRITAPLAWPTLISGAVMSWARALGEFGATIIFAGNFPGRTQTMPLAIYIGFERDLHIAITLAVLLLIISFGVLFTVKVILGQRVRM